MQLILILIYLRPQLVAIASLVAFGAASGPPPHATGAWIEREAFVMGATLEVRLAASSREEALVASEAAFRAARRMDDLLSTWRDDASLMRLNRAAPGELVPVPVELTALLDEVRRWTAETEGAFDPAIGALVDAWDLRGAGRRPSDGEIRRALAARGWLDSGGFGKGAALRAARDTLAALGIDEAFLNFGGQTLAMGTRGGRPWPVWVANPARRDAGLIPLRLGGYSAATTAQSERFIEVAGRRYGHVLDPRTGYPVAAWGSVTVVARDPLVADILSTALFVLGPERGRAWAQHRADVAALFLVQRGDGVDATWTPAMERFLPHRTPTLSRTLCDSCVH